MYCKGNKMVVFPSQHWIFVSSSCVNQEAWWTIWTYASGEFYFECVLGGKNAIYISIMICKGDVVPKPLCWKAVRLVVLELLALPHVLTFSFSRQTVGLLRLLGLGWRSARHFVSFLAFNCDQIQFYLKSLKILPIRNISTSRVVCFGTTTTNKLNELQNKKAKKEDKNHKHVDQLGSGSSRY